MVNPRRERHLRRFEGVVGREVDVEKEYAAAVGAFVWAHDGGCVGRSVCLRHAVIMWWVCTLPVKKIVSDGPCRAIRRRVSAEILRRVGRMWSVYDMSRERQSRCGPGESGTRIHHRGYTGDPKQLINTRALLGFPVQCDDADIATDVVNIRALCWYLVHSAAQTTLQR